MCWFSIARTLMYIFNFALFAAGAAVLGVGIWITNNEGSTAEILGVQIAQNGAIILIVAGSVALIIGFLGCCGAKKKSTGLLGLYFTCLLVVVILQIAVGIWALVKTDSIGEVVDNAFLRLDLNEDDNVESMNNIAKQLNCCGRNDSVCNEVSLYNLTCPSCTAGSEGCSLDCNVPSLDCATAMKNGVQDNMRIIAGIGLGIGLFEMCGLILSMCMCQTLKDSNGYA